MELLFLMPCPPGADTLHCCANYYRHLPMNAHFTKQSAHIQGKSNFFEKILDYCHKFL